MNVIFCVLHCNTMQPVERETLLVFVNITITKMDIKVSDKWQSMTVPSGTARHLVTVNDNAIWCW